MRNAVTGLALLVVSCIPIQPPTTPQHDKYGNKIVFLEDQDNPHGASAKYIEGIPTIKYNPSWMNQFPEEFQHFIFFHEVAHFKRGDLDNWSPYTQGRELKEMQQGADCNSLLYLRDNLHYTPDQFAKIYEFATLHFDEKRTDDMVLCLTQNNH